MNEALIPLLLVTPVMLLLALGIVGFVIRYQRRLMQQQEQMQQLRQTAREQAQQQALEAALLAQEEERHRIAAELHDGVGTTLAIVKLHLGALPQPDLAQQATALLDQAIGEVRRISRNLLPAVLQKFGLPFALEALARTVPVEAPTRVALAQHGQPRRLDPKWELIAYRVVQELLSNGLRHAKATLIDISVTFGDTCLDLYYADDGVGFDPAESDALPGPGARPGLGISNLRSRVAVLQGTLSQDSKPGAGTQVWISLPLPYLTPD